MSEAYTTTMADQLMGELQTLARSGLLSRSIEAVFGSSPRAPELQRTLNAIANGDVSVLPSISTLSNDAMKGHFGAYSHETNTIFLHEGIQSSLPITREVLYHEIAHYIAEQFFGGAESATDSFEFTRALLGDQSPILVAHDDAEHKTLEGEIILDGQDQPISVEWFDTQLHIDWAKAQLPMMTAEGFAIFARAENETDAFYSSTAKKLIVEYSPYGLQTQSASHFDNNNIRGGMETVHKRWSDGIGNFNSTKIDAITNSDSETRDKAWVGPGFSGADAGVQNLIYRFGQVSHALQDFYSHSNWVENYLSGRITSTTLLDSGLGLPSRLNPGDYVTTATDLMVAMSGINYANLMKKAGTGSYSGSSKDVYWWVNLTQDPRQWATTHGNLLDGKEIGALMSGAVSGAVYADTDYSLPLRALNRSGFFEQEYFRGYSHGGFAGTIYGQWVSPIAKDSAPSDRYSNGSSISYYAGELGHKTAEQFANLQVRNEWDRMGNMINEKYGKAGLQKFADFAVTEAYRATYVETYSQPGARWNWGNAALTIPDIVFQLEAAQMAQTQKQLAETPLRQIEVFYASDSATLNSSDNRTYLTQVLKDGVWVDSAAGLVTAHLHDINDGSGNVFSAAPTQHGGTGGRGLAIAADLESASPLASIYDVENINTQARVFINDFDVGLDQIRIVDGNGQVLKVIDVDHANYPDLQKQLLAEYNIVLNARAETEALTSQKIVLTKNVTGPLIIKASEFFSDADLRANGATHGPSTLSFSSYDESVSWLKLRSDGSLEITDISKVIKGQHEIYVGVSDGSSEFAGQRIVLSIDPEISVGGVPFASNVPVDVTFTTTRSSAIDLYGVILDANGQLAAEPKHLALRLGDNAGTPLGFDANHIASWLGDDGDHGTMQFLVDFHDGLGLRPLAVQNVDATHFNLNMGGETIASLAVGAPSNPSIFIDEVFVEAVNAMMLALPLDRPILGATSRADASYEVNFTVTLAKESDYTGEFGLFLADVRSGNVIDPKTGLQMEGVKLDYGNIDTFTVFSSAASPQGPVQKDGRFVIDGDLNLDNLALLPFFKVHAPTTSYLLFGNDFANPDGIEHIVRIGQNIFGCEDLLGGGDLDYDDMVATIGTLSVRELLAA